MEKKDNIIIWKFYQAVNWPYWFIEVDWEDEHIFVFWKNKKNALDQDIVKAKIKHFKWKIEAEILEVVKRADRLIIWLFQKNKKWKYWFVKPFNPSIKNDIFIHEKYINNAKKSEIVAVRILNWWWKNPEWKIVEILWNEKDLNSIINWYILEYWFKINFPKKVINDSRKIKNDIIDQIKIRKNLRQMFTFTIDWEDAKDLDDAISIEKHWNWYKLFVHIADVSHYVKSWTSIQNEAYLRWTSVYLPNKVLPMFPETISNNLCSLNPNTDKLTLTCEINLDKNWIVKNSKIYESVINSNYRLTYKEVQEIYDWLKKVWEKLMFGWKITDELINKIFISFELKNIISSLRKKQWILLFDFPETKIVLDENLKVIDFKPYPLYESNKVIEEFMILANESVSKKFSKIPFLYRIHEKPKYEDIEKLKKILNVFWIKFNFVNYDTKEFAELIDKLKYNENKVILEKIILRTLQKAIYSDKNVWHFWLWLQYYSHFTSPIRRYPDYQIHRLIKYKINSKLNPKLANLYKNKLENIAKHCSEQEIKAQKLEYKIRDFFMVQYYRDKIWEEFEWIVSWMIQIWLFVMLKNTAEWFVQLINDKDKYSDWEVDLDILKFKNSSKNIELTMWQVVKVKLIWIDEKALRLNFELI